MQGSMSFGTRSSPTNGPDLRGPDRAERCRGVGRDHRRHGPRTAGRHPGGDPFGHRARGARSGRGDAGGRARVDPVRGALARGGRSARFDPDREPPGEPEGRDGEPGGDPAGAPPRARAAGGPHRAWTDAARPGAAGTAEPDPPTAATSTPADPGHRAGRPARRPARRSCWPPRSGPRAHRPARSARRSWSGRDGPIAGTLGCAEFDAAALEGAREALATGEPATQDVRARAGLDRGVPRTDRSHAAPADLLGDAGRGRAGPVGPGGRVRHRWSIEPRAERHGRAAAGDGRSASRGRRRAGASTSSPSTRTTTRPDCRKRSPALLRTDARFVGVMGSARHVGPHIAGAAGPRVRRGRPRPGPLARSG